MTFPWILGVFGFFVVGIVGYDITQRKHAILRNFRIIYGYFYRSR